jgi:hypothetical protein
VRGGRLERGERLKVRCEREEGNDGSDSFIERCVCLCQTTFPLVVSDVLYPEYTIRVSGSCMYGLGCCAHIPIVLMCCCGVFSLSLYFESKLFLNNNLFIMNR